MLVNTINVIATQELHDLIRVLANKVIAWIFRIRLVALAVQSVFDWFALYQTLTQYVLGGNKAYE